MYNRRMAVTNLSRTSIPQSKGHMDVSNHVCKSHCMSTRLVEMLRQQLSSMGRRFYMVFHQHTRSACVHLRVVIFGYTLPTFQQNIMQFKTITILNVYLGIVRLVHLENPNSTTSKATIISENPTKQVFSYLYRTNSKIIIATIHHIIQSTTR